MRFLRFKHLLVVSPLVACMNMDHGGGHGEHHGSSVALEDFDPQKGASETVVAKDLDPAADVVSVELEAKPADIEIADGRTVRMWTYNGVFPGPRIEAKVGDKVRVKLKNALPDATTIHWHGLRLPASQDGAPAVQGEIEPGETYTYEFEVKDAGTFWYHPHMHSDVQVERGLYGAFVVRGESEPEVTGDHVVVLDDILLDGNEIAPESEMMDAMMGREGNVLVINGRPHPVIEVKRGGVERFRFINAANARYFRLSLPGTKLVWIGADGAFFERAEQVDEVFVVPGQRVDVLVVPEGKEGSLQTFQTNPYSRGHGANGGPVHDVLSLRIKGQVENAPALPDLLGEVEELENVRERRVISLEEDMNMDMGGGCGGDDDMEPVFSINGETYPSVTPLKAKLGAVEEWSIENTTEMDHPFHLHGFRFQVVAGAGNEKARRAFRDTINVPAESTVKIRMRLEDHPGTWMFHCHILEHAERGMMGELEVSED